jgi:hypothetical protein
MTDLCEGEHMKCQGHVHNRCHKHGPIIGEGMEKRSSIGDIK